MLVKALAPFDLGKGGGLRHPSVVGKVYDLPDSRARKLIALGAAELAEPEKKVAKKTANKVAKKAGKKADA
jgi:hypothetical protein